MLSLSIARLMGFSVLGAAAALSNPMPETDTLRQYLTSLQCSCNLHDRSMEVKIQAALPKLKKQGIMQGLKVISTSGQVAYRFLRFTGDKLVKTDVIARFLTADAQPPETVGNVARTEENYKFRFLRTADYQGATAYVYQLTPRKKRVGLFKGELWLNAETGTPVREKGESVNSPSVFIKRVKFVRDYTDRESQPASCGAPQRTSITVETRIAGDAEMVVWQRPVPAAWQPADTGGV